MRRPVLAGNWKMHKTVAEARATVEELLRLLKEENLVGDGAELPEVVVCPPFTALAAVSERLSGTGIALGAQNVYWEAEGAYTGEVSPAMLADLGCRYVIVGHSERRTLLGESDEQVARKVRAVLDHGMTPIVCVGESWPERQQGWTEGKLALQVRAATAWVNASEAARLVFAYEPIWAIGTGQNADGETAARACRVVRAEVERLFGAAAGAAVRVQYGGSVKPDNVGQFAAQGDIDGALVGGASLKPDSFAAIVKVWLKEGRNGA